MEFQDRRSENPSRRKLTVIEDSINPDTQKHEIIADVERADTVIDEICGTPLTAENLNTLVNIQSDWNEIDGNSDAFIKNKPTSMAANGGNSDTVDGKHASDFATAQQGTKADNAVPNNRTVAGQALSSDITAANLTGALIEATTSAKGLLSSTDKTKLNGVASGAQVNILEGVQANGSDLTISNKKVNITPSGIGAAAAAHTHAESDITNLTTDLAGKAPTSHANTGTIYGIGNDSSYGHVKLNTSTAGAALASSGAVGSTGKAADAGHVHPFPTAANVGAAATAHTHAESDITNLTSDLAGKAAANHAHGDISNTGTLSTTAITPAAGDYIVLTDYSNSNKLQRGIALTDGGKIPGNSLAYADTSGTTRGAVRLIFNSSTGVLDIYTAD
jgi:hypothetical protein